MRDAEEAQWAVARLASYWGCFESALQKSSESLTPVVELESGHQDSYPSPVMSPQGTWRKSTVSFLVCAVTGWSCRLFMNWLESWAGNNQDSLDSGVFVVHQWVSSKAEGMQTKNGTFFQSWCWGREGEEERSRFQAKGRLSLNSETPLSWEQIAAAVRVEFHMKRTGPRNLLKRPRKMTIIKTQMVWG